MAEDTRGNEHGLSAAYHSVHDFASTGDLGVLTAGRSGLTPK
ncbi:MAG: hypothetical protein ACLQIQ_19145 [Beijerinckiaceae bacterium]